MLEFLTPNNPALFAENDALTIQNAIAAAEKDGCRKLRIPRYNLRTRKNECALTVRSGSPVSLL